jgi:hypothetical protein
MEKYTVAGWNNTEVMGGIRRDDFIRIEVLTDNKIDAIRIAKIKAARQIYKVVNIEDCKTGKKVKYDRKTSKSVIKKYIKNRIDFIFDSSPTYNEEISLAGKKSRGLMCTAYLHDKVDNEIYGQVDIFISDIFKS